MAALVFQKAQGMSWGINKVTDHNRSPIDIDNERIEDSNRMANGRMRKYVVADKRTITTSWENLPSKTDKTVDGFWGGEAMRNFYRATSGEFMLTLNYGDGSLEIVPVVFTGFDYSVVKRGDYVDLWSVEVKMEEV